MSHIILENTICGNAGDGSIMLGIEKMIYEACGDDVNIIIYDHDAETARDLYPEQEFRQMIFKRLFKVRGHIGIRDKIRNFKSNIAIWTAKKKMWGLTTMLVGYDLADDIRSYIEADMVITTGGNYLVERYNLDERIKQFGIDLYLGKPPVLFTQSLGPFTKYDIREGLKQVFDASPLILLRDKRSKRHLEDLMEDTSGCEFAADAAFALAELDEIEKKLASEELNDISQVAISVRDWPFFKKRPYDQGMDIYMNAISALTQKLVGQYGMKVTFISSCQGLHHFKYDDSSLAKEIFLMLPETIKEAVTIDRDANHPNEIMDILRDMDLVVATRLHMMILALCVGVPVLPISYDPKTTELAQSLGIRPILSEIEAMTCGDLMMKADTLLGDIQTYHKKMLRGTLAQYDEAMGAVSHLKKAYSTVTKKRYSPSIAPDNSNVSNDTRTDAYSAA